MARIVRGTIRAVSVDYKWSGILLILAFAQWQLLSALGATGVVIFFGITILVAAVIAASRCIVYMVPANFEDDES